MRYLGHLGLAAQVAARATSDTRATSGWNAEDLPGEPGLPEDRASAWRTWAGAGTAADREVRLLRGSAPGQPGISARESVRIREQRPAELGEGLTMVEEIGAPAMVPASRRLVDWLAQIVRASPD